ncbi:type III polyketide synthase BpsA [soil metagenome]
MPFIIDTAPLRLPHWSRQSELKDFAKNLFSEVYKDIDRLLEVFDNTGIESRNLCVPVEFFKQNISFSKKNKIYQDLALTYSIQVIEDLLKKTNVRKEQITDLIFVSSTGLATPGIDASIINDMKLNDNVRRTPIWGLGCAGGVSGIEKAYLTAKALPESLVLLVCVELCSLTFIKNDLSKSNFVATSLFSDGVCACLIAGDLAFKELKTECRIEILDTKSKLYPDSRDVMGWEIIDEGLKVVFSQSIPSIVEANVRNDITDFLSGHELELGDLKNFIVHPGGTKVIQAYEKALDLKEDDLFYSKKIIRENGNMSSATVLYILNEFIMNGMKEEYGLLMALGPGFSSSSVLVKVNT